MANPSDEGHRVCLRFVRAKDSGDPYAFRFEPQDYILLTASGGSESARFEWTQKFLDELKAVRLPGRDPALLRSVGNKLYDFMKQVGWAEEQRELTEALDAGRRVYLTIRSSAAELYALPWELLPLKRGGPGIGEEDQLLLRFEWPHRSIAQEFPAPRHEGGRILVAWSAAGGRVPAAEHISAIHEACEKGFHRFERNPDAPAPDVLAHTSLARIVETLEAAQKDAPIAVLHILCHGAPVGSTFGLSLDGASGRVVVDAAQVSKQLKPFASMVRLIVLSACDSGNSGELGSHLGSVAQELHRAGFQSVIASRFPLSWDGSIQLTETLYGTLLSGPASLETAFLAARKRLARDETSLRREQQRLDWASVQLYACHADGDDGDDTRPIVFRPYRGLLSFEPQHRRFFFGRDREEKEILRDLRALVEKKDEKKTERFLIVAGASGTGKSSLVLAGAVPKLLQENPQLTFLRMRPGRDPEGALNAELAKYRVGTAALLVVDQFEELFTQTEDPKVREAFVRRLWARAADPEPGLRIIVTLRVDFIGRCGELVLDASGLRLDQIAYEEAYRVFVAQLKPEQLRQAIVKPAHIVGLKLEEGLDDHMLESVGAEPGALPLLEDALDVLWQRRSGRTLTQREYKALGGVVGALQKRADALLEKLTKENEKYRDLAQHLLINLVAVAQETALDTRLRVPIVELRQTVAAADPDGFERVLRSFVSERLLVQGEDEKAATVEVAHEALIRKWPTLRTWLDQNRVGLLMQRRIKQAAEQWETHQRDESLLYRGTQLAQAADWRKTWKSPMGERERQFLHASETQRIKAESEKAEQLRREKEQAARLAAEQRQREQQKLEAQRNLSKWALRAALILGVLLLGAVGAGVQAYRKSREAERNAAAAKQKSEEARGTLLAALAPKFRQDPTAVATLLREQELPDSPLWTQPVIDAFQTGIASVVLRGHESAVNSVAFSPDGKRVATGSDDNTARIWSADGFGEPLVLKGHQGAVHSVSFSPDGRKLVTGSDDKTARIWSADGSGEVVLRGHQLSVRAVAFSPDGKKLVTGSDDGTARIWNANGSGEPLVLKIPWGSITAVAFSPDGKKLVTGSWDKARIWNADGSGEPLVLKESTDYTGYTIDDFEYEAGRLQADAITAVAFSLDSKKLVTGSRDKTARIWNADGSGEPLVLTGHASSVESVAFSTDGKKLVTGSRDETARLWNLDGSGEPLVLKGHQDAVLSVAFSPDGKKLVTGSRDKTARIWNRGSSGEPLVLMGHQSTVVSVAFSADGKKALTGSGDKTARLWNADGSGEPLVLSGHQDTVYSVAFSADGKKLLTGSGDKTARLWNADGSGEAIVLRGHQGAVYSVAFSADGKKLLTGSEDKTARLWNADGSGEAIVLRGHQDAIHSVAFSPDGKKLFTGSGDKTARIWNADGSGEPLVLSGHQDLVYSVAFSPDGRKLLTGSWDKTARIWNADGSGEPLALMGHQSSVYSVAFSPDGKKLLTGSHDKTARLWNADGFGYPVVLAGHESVVTSIAFSPDGKRVITGSGDRTARIWMVAGDLLVEAMWSATTDCLPQNLRQDLLLESPAVAKQRYGLCRQEVARRRGWPVPAAP